MHQWPVDTLHDGPVMRSYYICDIVTASLNKLSKSPVIWKAVKLMRRNRNGDMIPKTIL